MRRLFLLFLVFLGGCQPTQGASDGGVKNGGATDGATSAPKKLSCVEILGCSSGCKDTTCDQACIQKGTPEGQQKVNALLDCGAKNMCTTAPCLEASCMPEITACAEDVASGGGGPPPSGAMPGDLVGTWQSVSGALPGASHKYTFDANGLFIRTYKFEESDCSNAVIKSKTVIDDGKWAVQGDVLMTNPDVSAQTTVVCAGGTSMKNFVGFNRSFKYTIMGNTLTLAETDGEETIVYMKQ